MEDNFRISIDGFNAHAQSYAQRFMNVNSYAAYIDVFCDNITESSMSILDVACGPGNVTKYIQNKLPNAKLTGIDLAPSMLDIAQEELPSAEFICMDALRVHELGNVYNAIMCSFCFPFFSKRNAQDFIRKAHTILHDKGVLYISTMEGESSDASFQTTSFSGENEIFFNYHLRKDVRCLLEANGFSVLKFEAQDYNESDGSISTDLIFIAQKV